MENYQLPPWLQITTGIATIISSIGVIVALWQIFVSTRQFEKQLATTTEQFVLQNQGYIISEIMIQGVTPTQPGQPISNASLFNGVNILLPMENVGNIPIKFKIKRCRLFKNGTEIMIGGLENVAEFPLYPKQKKEFPLFGYINPGALINYSQLNALNLSFEILVEYKDFNSSKIRTIDRKLKIIADQNMVTGLYTDINDQI